MGPGFLMRAIGIRVSGLVTLLLTVALAGCSDEAPQALDTELPDDAVVSEDGRDLRTDLLATDAAPGPDWAVGDWFGHHIFFGEEDTEGTHINVVVTEDRGNDWYLVSEDTEIGMYEAIFDVPITGTLSKKDLDTTAFGGLWQVYDFPMSHNKTWTGTMTFDVDWTFDLTFTATYQDSFQTTAGNRPGFVVIGVDSSGRTVVETDYVPAIGWYTQFVAYDVEPPEPEVVFRSISMGTGHNWTGEYTDYTASDLLNTYKDFFPDPSADPPVHAEAIAVSESTSLIAGIMYSYAAAGITELRLFDPENQVAISQSGTHIPPPNPDPSSWGGVGNGDLYVLNAIPGDWHLLWVGAAVATGFGAQLWALEATTGSL